jgi:hypothetical protein
MKDCYIQRELGLMSVSVILMPHYGMKHHLEHSQLLAKKGYLLESGKLTKKGLALKARIEAELERVEEPQQEWK